MEFILENENLRVTVESHGAELVSVVNRQTGEELLWQADPECRPLHWETVCAGNFHSPPGK